MLVASLALLASCGRESDAVRTDHHDIESREEHAAAEQVRAYLKAVRAGKPRLACKALVGRAAVRHRCAGRARLQSSLSDLPSCTFGSHFVAYSSPDEMQQAIEIESPRVGAVIFDLRRHTPSDEWRIFQIGIGGYG